MDSRAVTMPFWFRCFLFTQFFEHLYVTNTSPTIFYLYRICFGICFQQNSCFWLLSIAILAVSPCGLRPSLVFSSIVGRVQKKSRGYLLHESIAEINFLRCQHTTCNNSCSFISSVHCRQIYSMLKSYKAVALNSHEPHITNDFLFVHNLPWHLLPGK